MKSFNKIFIQCKAYDLVIIDGDKLKVTYASYCVKNNCLYVLPYDDTNITVPYGRYEDISILTTSGDCSIDLVKSSINQLTFDSDTGDLVIDAPVDELAFNSLGDVYAREDSPIQEMVHCSSYEERS